MTIDRRVGRVSSEERRRRRRMRSWTCGLLQNGARRAEGGPRAFLTAGHRSRERIQVRRMGAKKTRVRLLRLILPRGSESQTFLLAKERSRQVFGLPGTRLSPHLVGAASQAARLSACGAVRSQLPLRGSSGFAPDSRLSLDVVLGTADGHNIFLWDVRVNRSRGLCASHDSTRLSFDIAPRFGRPRDFSRERNAAMSPSAE